MRVQGSGYRVQIHGLKGPGLRVQGSDSRAEGFRGWGGYLGPRGAVVALRPECGDHPPHALLSRIAVHLARFGFRAQGLGFGVQGIRFRV